VHRALAEVGELVAAAAGDRERLVAGVADRPGSDLGDFPELRQRGAVGLAAHDRVLPGGLAPNRYFMIGEDL